MTTKPKVGLDRSKTGRKKGTPNKTTALLKDAILKAAELAGDSEGLVGYLKIQASANPGPFMALLGKVLPMQVTGEDGGPVTIAFKTVYERRRD
jgi:hypothetical protein